MDELNNAFIASIKKFQDDEEKLKKEMSSKRQSSYDENYYTPKLGDFDKTNHHRTLTLDEKYEKSMIAEDTDIRNYRPSQISNNVTISSTYRPCKVVLLGESGKIYSKIKVLEKRL